MNVDSLLDAISKINLNTDEDTYFLEILHTMSDAAEVGINAIVYEIITLDNSSIQNICNRIKDTFPDIVVTINNKRIYIDWS
jgi:hypothetical protein